MLMLEQRFFWLYMPLRIAIGLVPTVIVGALLLLTWLLRLMRYLLPVSVQYTLMAWIRKIKSRVSLERRQHFQKWSDSVQGFVGETGLLVMVLIGSLGLVAFWPLEKMYKPLEKMFKKLPVKPPKSIVGMLDWIAGMIIEGFLAIFFGIGDWIEGRNKPSEPSTA